MWNYSQIDKKYKQIEIEEQVSDSDFQINKMVNKNLLIYS